MSMFETIGVNNPTYLLEDPQGADVIAIPCEPGNGVVKRGTVMYRKNSGKWAPAANANVAVTNMLAVLDESVDTGADADAEAAEDARAFRSARLIYGKVMLTGGAALSAANIVVLRNQGIVFERMSSIVTITYDANGGTGDAVTQTAAYMESVNAKAGTIFTAPAGKSFSKWNTKADGTGTDYTAAAAATFADDTTLYAVWAS